MESTVVALIVVLSAVGIASFVSDQEPKAKGDTAADTQALAARLEEERAKRHAAKVSMCTDGIEKLKAEASDFMKQGKPAPAAAVLGACESLMQDRQAISLLADAKKAREAEERKAHKEQAAKQAKLDAAEKARKKREGVSIGMTQQDALDSSWGKPERINRTVTANGVREQWVYGNGNYLYFTNGILTAYQN
jgi:hypothetical protein